MCCKLCHSNNVNEIYCGKIRNGALDNFTIQNVTIYQCGECGTIWHDKVITNMEQYYESKEYRNSLEGSSDAEDFYKLHDKESLNKFQYTGTDIFRHKIVADIGCGCGAFLDYLSGVAKEIIAIEPSKTYRKIMEKKGFHTFAYAKNAMKDYREKIDVVTSFDVIEHVERPDEFISDIYNLLSKGGSAVIGTPTDAPVMRGLLGTEYEKKLLFSTQHLWILSEKILRIMAEKAGFNNIRIKYFQRYGFDNMLGWVRDKEPHSEIKKDFINDSMNNMWKSYLEQNKLADYIVLYLEK